MKRLFDIFIALTLLIIFSPILLLVAIFVRFDLGAPILFRQQRPGLLGKPFVLNKFRTMREATSDELSSVVESDPMRITHLGRFLRSTSLDELPSLWNVLIGEMSLVGPRPLLMDYLTRYTPFQARRHEVRPGITGYAQVNGRNSISWEDKFNLDVWYVENNNFILDFKILWKTIKKVAIRDGITAEGEATTKEFIGKTD